MEKKMKRFWILTVAALVMFFAVSCGSESKSGENQTDSDRVTTDEDKNDEEPTDAEVTDTEITDTEITDAEVTDADASKQCEDSEGRIYNEGDSISHECRAAYCCSYGEWCEDESECYHCPEVGGKMEWTCADGVTKVEWCECVEIEDETYGTEWSCIERADLNCPNE